MNNIRIYNTLTNKKDELKPMNGKKINFFVCGPTVYDYSHLGHARSYVIFDAFVKYLKHLKYNVFYLQNITDIDDKIIARSRERKVSPKALALAFEKEYLKNMKLLGVDSVTKYARATNYMKKILSQVKRLQDKGYAYELKGDGIYFDISKFKKYGKLSGRTAIQAEDAVSRIDYSKNKRNRGDFCLWKFKQDSSEPSWPAPFGEGRPGWHIEDTAISEKFFGAQYDIHAAARDLIFPHHEAEISQMEALSGKSPMAKYWMHAGFLTVNGQKMSKSLGNFITIDDFLKRYPVRYLRFFITKNLWSSPVDFSDTVMIEARSTVEKIEDFLRKLKGLKSIQTDNQASNLLKQTKEKFYNELADDFNTPKAYAVFFDLIKTTNQLIDVNGVSKKEGKEIYDFFVEINKIFGIIDFKKVNEAIPKDIKELAKEREKCRDNREWKQADVLRAKIEKQGYVVEDTKDGPVVKKM